jgi:hypothetical protein
VHDVRALLVQRAARAVADLCVDLCERFSRFRELDRNVQSPISAWICANVSVDFVSLTGAGTSSPNNVVSGSLEIGVGAIFGSTT